jgi:hypothetical protein
MYTEEAIKNRAEKAETFGISSLFKLFMAYIKTAAEITAPAIRISGSKTPSLICII